MFSLDTRILVVDDMATMRKLIMKTFKELGFKSMVEAQDGASAWELMNSANPPFGLVVSDWNMPISSGIDLLKRVRSDSRFRNIPFIMISAESEAKQISEALSAGVTDFIIKPFSTDVLKTKLEAAHKKAA